MPDRFVEHPNLRITMTNVKFSELGSIEGSKKSKKKRLEFNLVLKNNNSFDLILDHKRHLATLSKRTGE